MKKPLRWIWRRRRLAAGAASLAALGGYGVLYAAVALHESPADRAAELPDGRRLSYLQGAEAPQGAPRVLLLHGAPADSSSWSKVLRDRAGALDGLEVLAVDRLGYGNSAPGTEPSLRAHAASLAPLLAPGAVLVGHSYGGPVALRAAAEFPELVGGVVLVAGACDANMNDAQWARRAADAASFAIPETWAVANRELLALTDENDEMRALLDRITCPVVIIHGEWDPVCPHDGTVEYLRSSLTPRRMCGWCRWRVPGTTCT
jgi:pimeloyl-ACP methyl ester carboxylesterase